MSPGSNTLTLPFPELQGLRILLVEDHVDSRDALVAVLQTFGAALVTAGSSHRAFELLRRHLPDVVVSDIGLPDEDGNGLMRRIRALSSADGGTTPAIAVTAYSTNEDRGRALAAGFDGFLVKPVNIDDLANMIALLVRRPK